MAEWNEQFFHGKQAPPDQERVPINIHPQARNNLRHLLTTHPNFESSGIGYSEFINRAVAMFVREGGE